MTTKLKIYKYTLVLLMILLLFSCKSTPENKITQKVNTINNDSINKTISKPNIEKILKDTLFVDFFDKKYKRQYTMILDESNLAEHPTYSHLDCKTIGYFTVHYIPKKQSKRIFWKKEYFANPKNIEVIDFEEESRKLKKKIIYKDYNIFCYRIKKGYLSKENGCTIEAVYPYKNSKGLIYYFNRRDKKWKIIDTISVKILPPYLDNSFFIKNYKNYFN